jgi:hypothetical protein
MQCVVSLLSSSNMKPLATHWLMQSMPAAGSASTCLYACKQQQVPVGNCMISDGVGTLAKQRGILFLQHAEGQ